MKLGQVVILCISLAIVALWPGRVSGYVQSSELWTLSRAFFRANAELRFKPLPAPWATEAEEACIRDNARRDLIEFYVERLVR